MRAEDYLQQALDALKQRASVRDQDSERSMAQAVKIYNSMARVPLTESEGWRFMLALKLARGMQGGFHADDRQLRHALAHQLHGLVAQRGVHGGNPRRRRARSCRRSACP